MNRGQPRGGQRGGGGHMGGPMGALAAGGEKAKDFKGTIRRLLRYMKPSLFGLTLVMIFTIASTAFNIVTPKISGRATDEIIKGLMSGHMNFDAIWDILVIVGVLSALGAVLSMFQQYIMTGITQRIVRSMRGDVNRKLERLPLRFFDSNAHGDVLSRFTNDIETVSQTLQQSVTQFISSAISIVGVLIIMLTISPILTLITLVTLPLSMFVATSVAKRSQKFFRQQQARLGAMNGHIEEMYAGHTVIKLFGAERSSVEDFKKLSGELYDAGWRAQFISGLLMPMMNFIGNLGYVLVCIAGGLLAVNGRITLGDIQAFIMYNRQFSQPITQMANIANIIQSAIAAAERVFILLDEPEETPDAVDAPTISNPKGHVRFENVAFSYTEDKPLITNLNVDVQPNQMVAIVGPTGAGKTTLVNLLMRFYEADSGRITIDGTPAAKMARKDLRALFGMVLQDAWLFTGSIADNIAFGREGATREQIVAAAKAARADHFIRTLPEGYDTILVEDASNISQGQKQLLTIARALLADPQILILDEATSSVDTRTEMLIQKGMAALMKGRTSFVIAHRLSTIRDADLILVMNHGDIIEQGTHKELLAKGAFYADLYNSQFTEAQAG